MLFFFFSYISCANVLTRTAYYIDNTLKANIYNSIFNADPGQPWAIPHYNCGTGNCTWDPVPSIAMRALCSDVSSYINNTCDDNMSMSSRLDCSIGIPDGVEGRNSMNGIVKTMLSLVVGVPKTPIVYKNTALPVIQRLEATEANTRIDGKQFLSIAETNTFIATECTLQPIVRSVNASVSNSRYEETTRKEWDIATKFSNDTYYPDVVFGSSLVPDWNEDLGNHAGQNFTISAFSRAAIADFMSTIFSGNVSSTSENLSYNRDKIENYATEDTLAALLYGDISGCADPNTKRFECVMDNIARAMSKTFRDQAYVRDKSTPDMARGITMANAIIVHVHWQWMTLPLLLWLLIAVAWAGAVWKTHRARVPKWYESPLPLLFLYRGDDDGRTQDMEGDLSVEAYEAKAKKIKAQLHAKDNQAAFIA